MTPIDAKTRRTINAIIGDVGRAMRSSSDFPHGPWIASIHRDPGEDVVIVRRLTHMHGPGDPPGPGGDLIGAGEIVISLGGVRLEKRAPRKLIDLQIAITADIVAAPIGLRVATTHDVLKDVGALERRGR